MCARYCGVVMDRFGDRIEMAVTFNEPDLPEMLTWAHMPDFVVALERATLWPRHPTPPVSSAIAPGTSWCARISPGCGRA